MELRWFWTETHSLRIDMIAGDEVVGLKSLDGWIAPEKWLLAAWDLEQNRSSVDDMEYELRYGKLRKRLMKKIPKAAKKEIRQIVKRL